MVEHIFPLKHYVSFATFVTTSYFGNVPSASSTSLPYDIDLDHTVALSAMADAIHQQVLGNISSYTLLPSSFFISSLLPLSSSFDSFAHLQPLPPSIEVG